MALRMTFQSVVFQLLTRKWKDKLVLTEGAQIFHIIFQYFRIWTQKQAIKTLIRHLQRSLLHL